ncbi:MAG: Ig-like domain-containing protein [Lachnospiraceae bacterium]|nr:Ig-like domain-containing protein [Lachnospiraceae bacterium]
MRKKRLALYLAFIMAFQPQAGVLAAGLAPVAGEAFAFHESGPETGISRDAEEGDPMPETKENGLQDPVPERKEGGLQDPMPEAGEESLEETGEAWEGQGYKEDPYQIYNAEQLKAVSNYHTAWFKLMNDIDLKGVDWGEYTFKGRLDGNGKTIRNLTVERSSYSEGCLFKKTDEDFTEISDLTLQNVTVRITGDAANISLGLMGGRMKSLRGCTVTGTVRVECEKEVENRSIRIGGMAYSCQNADDCCFNAYVETPFAYQLYFGGVAYEARENAQYTNCSFGEKGRLSLSGNGTYAAGIAWEAEQNALFEKCEYLGRMTADPALNTGASLYGILGSGYSSRYSEQDLIVRNCETAKHSLISVNQGRAAGIIGDVDKGNIVESCTNRGIIKGEETNSSASGIASNISGGLVSDCLNEGTVKAGGSVAGIALWVFPGYGKGSVSSCINAGTVNGTGQTSAVGGIAVNVQGSIISECINEGEVNGYQAGGIANDSKGQMTFADCFNEGKVTGEYAAAGIVAQLRAEYEEGEEPSLITGCYNAGEVFCGSSDAAAGIVGWLDGDVTLSGCYNIGTVHGYYASGVASWMGTQFADYEGTGVNLPKIVDCFNLGRVESTGTGGGIVSIVMKGDILRCFNAGTLALSRRSDGLTGYVVLGGIAGDRMVEISSYEEVPGGQYNPVRIQNCFAAGNYECDGDYASGDLGGIMGSASLSPTPYEAGLLTTPCRQTLLIENCYNASKLQTEAGLVTGGIFGSLARKKDLPAIWNQEDIIKVLGSYYSDSWKKLTPYDRDYGWTLNAAAKNDQELRTRSTYAGWDFTDTWDIGYGLYRYPVLQNEGAGLLQEAWGGDGAKLTCYKLRAIDRSTEAGVRDAYVSFSDYGSKTDRNGIARFYMKSKAAQYTTITSPLYETWTGMVHFNAKKPFTAELKQDIKLKPPALDAGSVDRWQGNVARTMGKYTFLYDANTSLGLDLTNFAKYDENRKTAIPFSLENDPAKQQVKISFGMNSKRAPSGFKDSYDWTKHVTESALRSGNKNEVPSVVTQAGRGLDKTVTIGSNSIKATVYYTGYVTIDYSTGSCKVVESGALIGMTGSVKATYSPVSTAGLAEASVSVSLGASGGFRISIDPKTSEMTAGTSISLMQGLSGEIMVGSDFLLQAGITFDAALTETFSHTVGHRLSSHDDMTVNMNLKTGLKAVILKREIECTLAEADATIYPTKEVISSGPALEEKMKNKSSAMTAVFGNEIPEAGTGPEDAAYAYSSPVMARLQDGTLIKAFLKGENLYYTVDDGEEKAVFQSDTADFDPVLATGPDRAYLVWIHAQTDSSDEEAWKKSLSIKASAYDALTHEFGTPVTLASGREKAPMVLKARASSAGLTAAWVENSENDLDMMSGKNTVYGVEYDGVTVKDPMTLISGRNGIYDLSLGEEGGKLSLAFTEYLPEEGENMPGSRILTVCEGKVTELTSKEQNGFRVFYLGDTLYYDADGMLYVKEAGKDPVPAGVRVFGRFLPVEGTMGHAVLFTDRSGEGTAMMASYRKGDTFTLPVRLPVEVENISPLFGAVYEESGGISLLTVRPGPESEPQNTTLAFFSGTAARDLVLYEELYHDTAAVRAGSETAFIGKALNNTDQEIGSLAVKLYKEGQEEPVSSQSLTELHWSPGNELPLSINYTLPMSGFAGNYRMEIESTQIQETNLENNRTGNTQVGLGNLCFDASETEMEEDGKLVRDADGAVTVKALLKNSGYTGLSGVSWDLILRKEDGEEILNHAEGQAVDPNGSIVISEKISAEKLCPDAAFEPKVLLLRTETAGAEANYGDNAEEFYVEPAAPESLVVKAGGSPLSTEEAYEMNAGDSVKLTKEITPSFAYQGVDYASSDMNVAFVDEEGNLIATGSGKAEITAETGDGSIIQTFPVIVRPDPSGIVYDMNPKGIELERGEDGSMSFIWMDLTPGQTAQKPQGNVVWENGNPDVASISEDRSAAPGGDPDQVLSRVEIHGKKEGIALIKATIQTASGNKSAFGIVSVKDSRVKHAEFSEKEVELGLGQSKKLELITQPEAPVSDFTFSSDQPETVRVDNLGNVTGLLAGTALISASYNKTEEGEEPIIAYAKVTVKDEGAQEHTLSFDPNGGNEIDPALKVQVKQEGEAFVFPADPFRAGCRFTEWNTEKDGTGVSYNGTETLIAGKDVIGSLTLYAIWKEASGMQAAPIPDQLYSPGKAIKPVVTIYDGTRLLIEGVDYQVSYKNNKKAADKNSARPPMAVIKGNGNYSGTLELPFTILPVSLMGNVSAEDIYLAYNKKVQRKIPAVKYAGKALALNKDFTVKYVEEAEAVRGAFQEPGTWTIQITGENNYTGSISVNEVITDKPLILKAKVSKLKNMKYTGKPLTQEYTVAFGAKGKLKEGEDYKAEWINNTEVGTASLVLTGINEYAGTKTVAFKILGDKIASCKVSGIPKNVIYCGKPIEAGTEAWKEAGGFVPALTITVKGEKSVLSENRDYRMTYERNVNKGTARVVFTGMGGYTGVLKKSFRITPYDIGQDKAGIFSLSLNGSAPYEKGGARPEVSVSFDGRLLEYGKDYSLGYKKNKKAGEQAQVTLAGKGNFKGKVQASFTVTKQDLGLLSLYIHDPVYKNKQKAYIPKITVMDRNGKTLKAGTDYARQINITDLSGNAVLPDAIPEAGTELLLSVSGNGNYEGSLTGNYRIVSYSLASAVAVIPSKEYTGYPIRPEKKDIELSRKPYRAIGEADYEIVSYGENIKKGKGTVLLHGTGEYGGYKTASFKIVSRKLSLAERAEAFLRSLFK